MRISIWGCGWATKQASALRVFQQKLERVILSLSLSVHLSVTAVERNGVGCGTE